MAALSENIVRKNYTNLLVIYLKSLDIKITYNKIRDSLSKKNPAVNELMLKI